MRESRINLIVRGSGVKPVKLEGLRGLRQGSEALRGSCRKRGGRSLRHGLLRHGGHGLRHGLRHGRHVHVERRWGHVELHVVREHVRREHIVHHVVVKVVVVVVVAHLRRVGREGSVHLSHRVGREGRRVGEVVGEVRGVVSEAERVERGESGVVEGAAGKAGYG